MSSSSSTVNKPRSVPLHGHFTRLGANLADDVTLMVADDGVKVGHDPDGVHHMGHADLWVCSDTFNAFSRREIQALPIKLSDSNIA